MRYDREPVYLQINAHSITTAEKVHTRSTIRCYYYCNFFSYMLNDTENLYILFIQMSGVFVCIVSRIHCILECRNRKEKLYFMQKKSALIKIFKLKVDHIAQIERL